jgi:hypothetical protein
MPYPKTNAIDRKAGAIQTSACHGARRRDRRLRLAPAGLLTE